LLSTGWFIGTKSSVIYIGIK